MVLRIVKKIAQKKRIALHCIFVWIENFREFREKIIRVTLTIWSVPHICTNNTVKSQFLKQSIQITTKKTGLTEISDFV